MQSCFLLSEGVGCSITRITINSFFQIHDKFLIIRVLRLSLGKCIHRFSPTFRVLHHLQGLLLQEAFFLRFRFEGDAMRLGMVVLVQIREGGEAIGGNLFGLTATVHLGVDRQGAAPHRDDLALEGDDVARENRELEVDAMQHKQNGVFRINILRHSEIRTLQEILGATTSEEGLVVVEVGEFD